jgi:integrase
MAATRPLPPEVTRELLSSFTCVRDQVLCTFMLSTGFRIEEARSLRVGDIWADGAICETITLERHRLKGGKGRGRRRVRAREVVLTSVLRASLQTYLDMLYPDGPVPGDYLFMGRQVAHTGGRKPISRVRAYQIIRAAASAQGLRGRIGTHSLRKTFAAALFEKSGHNLLAVQKGLGHRSVMTTSHYLDTSQAEVDSLVASLDIPIGFASKPPEVMNVRELIAAGRQSEPGADRVSASPGRDTEHQPGSHDR